MDDSNLPGLAPDGFDPDSDLMWLVQQCQDGDETAIASLVERYYPWLCRLCRLLLSDSSQLAACVEESFGRALLALARYHGTPDIRLWLARYALAAARRRNRQVEPASLSEPLQSLYALPTKAREALILKAGLGLSLAELALIAETTPAQAQKRLEEATGRLAQTGVLLESLQASMAASSSEVPCPEGPGDPEIVQRVLAARDARKRRQRWRLLTFEITWAVLGILLLAGTVQVIDRYLAPEVETPVESDGELLAGSPAPGPSLTPTPTLLPYEETQANAASYAPAISGDGRIVAFTSEASNLTPGDTNGFADVFLFDRQTVALEMLSIRPDGEQANGPSGGASLSADGRYVAFVSWATNLVDRVEPACEGGRRACAQVYLLDRQTGELRLLSQVRGAPGDGDSGMSGVPAGVRQAQTSISGDGRWVAFASLAGNLTGTPGVSGVLLVDTRSGDLRRVDRSHDGRLVDGHSIWPVLSQDRRYLAFQTLATNLVTDDLNQAADIYRYDIANNHLERVTIGREGTGAKGHSTFPAISADGRYVAFRSSAWDLLPGDSPATAQDAMRDQLFLYDHDNRSIDLLSRSASGVFGNGNAATPALSADGGRLAFVSQATNLVDAQVSASWDIFLKDRADGAVRLLSSASGGEPAHNFSHSPAISADGRLVVFVSHAANLVEGDVNAAEDIFLFDGEAGTLRRINLPYWLIQE
jgi:Tol biopolymer transport system component/DNA-directed RNA polymerase specialized sigma24 family protein